MELNKESLEKNLSQTPPSAQPMNPPATAQQGSPVKTEEKPKNETPEMPKEMEIGFHQGALNTLALERVELIKIIQNVEKIMGMHVERMKQLGVQFEEPKKQ